MTQRSHYNIIHECVTVFLCVYAKAPAKRWYIENSRSEEIEIVAGHLRFLSDTEQKSGAAETDPVQKSKK